MPVDQLSPGQFALENNTRVNTDTVNCNFTNAGGGKIKMEISVVFTPSQMNGGDGVVPFDPKLGNCAVLDFNGANIALRAPMIIAAAVSDANITMLVDAFSISGRKGKLGEPLND